VMSKLYPLATVPTIRPSAPGTQPSPVQMGVAATQLAAPPIPGAAAARAKQPPAPPVVHSGPREKLEANVGATTESNFFVGFSGDIADGGVFIATYATFPVGAPVEVLVTLPGGYESTFPGTVRFVRDPMDMESEPGVGVRFERLTAEQRDLVLRFIKKRPPLFYDE
ncbi:MAG TPA: PilZ domain-containing protein, partial [Polyangiales bacterium]|nr:PilZ domain-containing protein [Polyangiales bacterium]